MKTALSREYLRAYYVNGRDITIYYDYTELEKKIIKHGIDVVSMFS